MKHTFSWTAIKSSFILSQNSSAVLEQFHDSRTDSDTNSNGGWIFWSTVDNPLSSLVYTRKPEYVNWPTIIDFLMWTDSLSVSLAFPPLFFLSKRSCKTTPTCLFHISSPIHGQHHLSNTLHGKEGAWWLQEHSEDIHQRMLYYLPKLHYGLKQCF